MSNLFTKLHDDLPVFGARAAGRSVLYAPGHMAVGPLSLLRTAREEFAENEPATIGTSMQLRRCAQQAVETWRDRLRTPFGPECLTIYLSDRCNLACPHCYSKPKSSRGTSRVISEKPIRAAAQLVAANCAAKAKPLHVVLHGGGEPTVEWEMVQRIEAMTREIAKEMGIDWYGYIATNGVLAPTRARWMGRHFDLIGLSCDGPPDIQDRQRPPRTGGESSATVERTADVLRRADAQFLVRATITPATVERQVEILEYLHGLGASEIRFEPVYGIAGGFRADDAPLFVKHLLAAERKAADLGCRLNFSGVRLDEIHGPYCNLLREVLHVTPDGTATACFRHADDPRFVIGHWDGAQDEFLVDHARIDAIRQETARIPKRCQSCIAVYHCSRDCPETCAIVADKDGPPGFRCLAQQLIAESWVLNAASMADSRHGGEEPEPAAAFLESLPPSVDSRAVLDQYEAAGKTLLSDRRTLPAPVWAERGLEHDGEEAWKQLLREIPAREKAGALSVYVHVPFCDRRCGFCDCYSLPLSARNRHREDDYADALLAEIDAWAGVEHLASRPVTTIHFGGGTPNHLSPGVFAQIVSRLRDRFAAGPDTEWALESVSTLISRDHLACLQEMGFTRLHVGVQTLEEPARRLIGRREGADEVVVKLRTALDMGFVTSVDLIFGLPGQTAQGLVSTLDRLIGAGLHGFSLYQLQKSESNRQFLERTGAAGRDPLGDYLLLQVAEQVLTSAGFRKTHFTHYARPEDANLYYSHPGRGEDLLALGPTADGVFGDYHYRHPEYDAYVAGTPPALEGGVRRNELERRLYPASMALMGGSITQQTLKDLGADSLLDLWLKQALVQPSVGSDAFVLTANGSWFVGAMLRRLRGAVAQDREEA